LVSARIAHAIANACVRDAEIGHARVVEIGAGTGTLTRLLAARAQQVLAIERDRDLAPLLARELDGTPVRVLETDALDADWRSLLGPPVDGAPRILCGNLPYAITGPILRRCIEQVEAVDRVVFMVQEEVALRLLASPGTPERGALSVFAQAAFDIRRVVSAPPGAFFPQPQVSSAVVELHPLRSPRARETPAFRSLVRAAFQARRKKLRNAWRALAADTASLERAAASAGVSLESRGETLGVDAFARMADALTASR
jgi:16S rRNA (adenine1518-N6/adenine1519-N6)-dimethyltransferase